ncbi:MAG: hypothetical protein B7C24_14745 [Bacteroidetes bacterium 4572_77]|nr:MAG: hypothetical protein B7C24_14745 [Bacteroidetes bacterium 4572_77]
MKIHSYEKALFSQKLNPERLLELQKEFPLFLGDKPLDTMQTAQLLAYVSDPYLQKLFEETQKVYPNLDAQEKAVSSIFRHIKFYYSNFMYPEVFSYISGSDDEVFYENQVLVIGLDRFLGAGFEGYNVAGIPRYKQFSMSPDYLNRKITMALAKYFVPAVSPNAPLLHQMIYEAKLLYFVQSMNPEIKENILLEQTTVNTQWLHKKEADIWRYYIENGLLYKSDYMDYSKFINDSPFTSVLGEDSAPRTGIFLGYQIVLSYMEKTKVSFKQLMRNTNPQSILQKSGYKPKQ